ncbi:MAG: NAD-dependent dehydratase [Deltaproteobacteria bacterium CG_4_10_14_0_2_um_filter_43_8]|nr:MAG: NAD-dependent dehydratase [Deltaproteobacteria bacterium CG11_big_fil_rev_8_21_14_0_20_42_23]PJA21725.1 MAG: NAD-dependent dehydratase [Deltaproteobacteria bacterium CG_4_10_14_0_2_um_filter_43_8]PJC64568.1 MAG: NAD-dependent dehydratase [Deltaproteobacteria bacterium CG_4_9_14_0_2_um_filter_42_21]
MLKNNLSSQILPERVVIIGAGGFVGSAITKSFRRRNAQVVALVRKDIDLLAENAVEQLKLMLRKNDALVVISAQAPTKNSAMLIDNLRMMAVVCDALSSNPVEHVTYISSDAVYADASTPLNETSCAQPTSLHGVMHLARETMLADAYKGSLCILRPTLIYGANDPHNGYGPNRFRRLAHQGEDIILFGEGEERRDHVYIDDVAEIATKCICSRSEGVLNIATGELISFWDLAKKVIAISSKSVEIITTPRVGLMPHGGYRAFDVALTTQVFPDFNYTPLDIGLALSQSQEFHDG